MIEVVPQVGDFVAQGDPLFRLYGGGRWRTLTLLRLPAALPYFLTGLRISGGLAGQMLGPCIGRGSGGSSRPK